MWKKCGELALKSETRLNKVLSDYSAATEIRRNDDRGHSDNIETLMPS